MTFKKGHCIHPVGCNECCKELGFELKNPPEDDIRRIEYLDTDKVAVERYPGKIRIVLKFPCIHLKDGKCDIYDKRPLACKLFPWTTEQYLRHCAKKEVKR